MESDLIIANPDEVCDEGSDITTGSETLPMVPISARAQSQQPKVYRRSVPNSSTRQTQNQSYCCNVC